MSVLEFIAAVKWPITVLLLAGFVTWRTRRNPAWLTWLKDLISERNLRLNIGGQEVELTAAEAAVRTATQSDVELGGAVEDASAEGGKDVTAIRREAVETVMVEAAHWGWNMAQLGYNSPVDPGIKWDDDGHPRILFTQRALSDDEARMAAILRRMKHSRNGSERERVTLLREMLKKGREPLGPDPRDGDQ